MPSSDAERRVRNLGEQRPLWAVQRASAAAAQKCSRDARRRAALPTSSSRGATSGGCSPLARERGLLLDKSEPRRRSQYDAKRGRDDPHTTVSTRRHRRPPSPHRSHNRATMTALAPQPRTQQEGPRPRQPCALRVHGQGHPQGQGHQALHRAQHGRLGCATSATRPPSRRALPKIYICRVDCIEAAVHQRIVRSRSRTDRCNRDLAAAPSAAWASVRVPHAQFGPLPAVRGPADPTLARTRPIPGRHPEAATSGRRRGGKGGRRRAARVDLRAHCVVLRRDCAEGLIDATTGSGPRLPALRRIKKSTPPLRRVRRAALAFAATFSARSRFSLRCFAICAAFRIVLHRSRSRRGRLLLLGARPLRAPIIRLLFTTLRSRHFRYSSPRAPFFTS